MEIKCVLGVINELECSQLGYWKTNGTPDFKELSGQVKWFLLLFLNNFFLFLGGEKEQWQAKDESQIHRLQCLATSPNL